MSLSLSNTSQSLIINTYYGFSCDEVSKLELNNRIDSEYSVEFMMQLVNKISVTLETSVLHTSSHSFKPSGSSLTSIIESNEPLFGSSGILHLNESHISFHSYFENSLNDVVILRLELHISSCSRKNVFFALDELSRNKHFENFDAMSLDYFHRGIKLDDIKEDKDSPLDAYLSTKQDTFTIRDSQSLDTFLHLKLIKKRGYFDKSAVSEYLYKCLI